MIQGAQQSGAQVAPRKVHNTALKWLRVQHDHPPGRPTVPRVDITRIDPLEIGVLNRDTGMAHTFVGNQRQQWSWRSMLASLSDDVLEQVVGEGVVTITREPRHGQWYDHARHHAHKRVRDPP